MPSVEQLNSELESLKAFHIAALTDKDHPLKPLEAVRHSRAVMRAIDLQADMVPIDKSRFPREVKVIFEALLAVPELSALLARRDVLEKVMLELDRRGPQSSQRKELMP